MGKRTRRSKKPKKMCQLPTKKRDLKKLVFKENKSEAGRKQWRKCHRGWERGKGQGGTEKRGKPEKKNAGFEVAFHLKGQRVVDSSRKWENPHKNLGKSQTRAYHTYRFTRNFQRTELKKRHWKK